MDESEPMFSLGTLDHGHKGAASAVGSHGHGSSDVDPFSLNPESSGIGGGRSSSAFDFDGDAMSATTSAFMMDLDTSS